MIALLNGLKDLSGSSANTSFMDWKAELWLDLAPVSQAVGPVPLQGHMVLIHWLQVCLQVVRSHNWNPAGVVILVSNSAGFTKFWMFPSMFSKLSQFLCFLHLWCSVRIRRVALWRFSHDKTTDSLRLSCCSRASTLILCTQVSRERCQLVQTRY